MPKSFDPAKASAPPETDIVRAIYEGLTDINPKTLQPVPAIAAEWKSSDDDKTWTFRLRHDARWSNGERVTAKDFVRSWKRLAEMGEEVSHYELLGNIVGMQAAEKLVFSNVETADSKNDSNQSTRQNSADSNIKVEEENTGKVLAKESKKTDFEKKTEQETKKKEKKEFLFGIEATDEFTLKISLIKRDKDFPALVAHPIFRPVHGSGENIDTDKLNAAIVTNGAFRVSSVGQDGVTLDRSENFWDAEKIKLERVKFVPAEDAEKALAAYRAGQVDAVTNADFEPLALKLLTPFDDFRRTTHSGLNFYEFNREKPPFNDRRVREALSIALERERLTEVEMEGASRPAFGFLPFDEKSEVKLVQNVERAKSLLTESGFSGGNNFPTVKLVVNRNNIQQRVARSVAKMWKQNLNVETEIVVKESAELETAKQTNDFDLIRRGVVLPTADEAINILTIFPVKKPVQGSKAEKNSDAETKANEESTENAKDNVFAAGNSLSDIPGDGIKPEEKPTSENFEDSRESETILTEKEALFEMYAIPLYFPTSYSLVKPYVQGFETNTLDAPSLKDVRIDNNW